MISYFGSLSIEPSLVPAVSCPVMKKIIAVGGGVGAAVRIPRILC